MPGAVASATVIDAKVHYNSRTVARSTPSGKKYLAGSGVYDMQVQKEFIVDAVDAAVQLIEEKGVKAFKAIRDKRSQSLFQESVYL